MSISKERRVCSVSNDGCRAPAGIGISGVGWADGGGSCRGTCYYCGEPVCGDRDCSKRTRKGRLCWNCQKQVAPR